MKSSLWQRFKDSETVDINDEEALNKVVIALQKSGIKRNEEELGKLYHIIKNNKLFMEFFNEMPEEASITLLTSFRHLPMIKGQEVFKYGDSAKLFYFILKGSVYIIAPGRDNNQNETPTSRATPRSQNNIVFPQMEGKRDSIKAPSIFGRKRIDSGVFVEGKRDSLTIGLNYRRKSILSNYSGIPKIDSFAELQNEPLSVDELKSLYPDHVLLNTLKNGDHFGEIALSFRCFRTATVVCREPCHFMVLNSLAYYRILSDYQDAVQQELFQFFKTFSFIKGWPSENIMGLMRQLKTIKAKRNYIVYDYGDPCDNLYIVHSGEVEITKNADIDLDDDDIFKMTSHKRNPMSLDKAERINFNLIWKNQHNQMHKQNVRVALLGHQQSFGEEEIISNCDRRITRAVVVSQAATIFAIPTEKFIENAPDPSGFYETLSNRNVKKDWREILESNLVKTNIQNDLKLRTKQLNSDEKSYIPIQGMGGIMKPDRRKMKVSSMDNIQTDCLKNEASLNLQLALERENSDMGTLSTRSNSNMNHPNRRHRRVAPKSVHLPGGLTGLVTTVYNSNLKEKDTPLKSSKLWDKNIAHHQKRPGGLHKKGNSVAHSRKNSQTSFEISPIKTENLQLEIRTPVNRSSNTTFINFKSARTDSIMTPKTNQDQGFLTPIQSKISPCEKLDSHNYKKMLSKKLGMDKLFSHEKSEIKIPPQFFISAPEWPTFSTRSPSSSKALATNSHTFSQMVGKINNSVNTGNLSPSIVMKLKSHMGSTDSIIPTSPTNANMKSRPSQKEMLNSEIITVSRRNSRKKLSKATL